MKKRTLMRRQSIFEAENGEKMIPQELVCTSCH